MMQRLGQTNVFLYRAQRAQVLFNDMEIREDLKKIVKLEREARWLNLQINVELYGRSATNLSKSIKSLGTGIGNKNLAKEESAIMNDLMNGSKNAAAASSGSSIHSDMEIIQAIQMMNSRMAEANDLRQKVFFKMNTLMRTQMNPANLEVAEIRRIAWARDAVNNNNSKRAAQKGNAGQSLNQLNPTADMNIGEWSSR
jgi:hypothetical protein